LARQVQVAVGEGWRGVVHGTCSGEATWHEFAKEIFARSGISADLSPCSTVDYPLPAPRPAYSVLDGSHRSVLGTDVMPHWREALADVIQNPEIK
jgi:dTDP-4-dehydrorhamnose reductase